MPPTIKLPYRLTSPTGSLTRWLLFFAALIFVCSSCREKTIEGSSSDYSDGFNQIYHSGKLKTELGMQFLDSSFHALSKPALNDTFRFYSLHFMYQKKIAHNASKELLYADSMINVALRCINEKQYVNFFSEANFAKGDAYFDQQQYSEAYRYFYEGYFLGKNHLNNEILAEYTYRMGMITFKQSHFKAAADHFKESYRLLSARTQDFNTFYQKQELLNDAGESYQHNGDIDSAQLYFDKAQAYINKNYDKFKHVNANMMDVALAVNYGDQGAIAYAKGELDKAEELFKKSIAIDLKKYNDNYNAELVEISLGQLYFDRHQDALFVNLMHDLGRQFDSVKNTEAETNWNKMMSNYYLQKKDPAAAFGYFQKYSMLKDSLNKFTISLKETDVNQQLADYDKQYQIQNLKDDNKIQQIYLYLAVICVVMAVSIIFLVYRNWKRSKQDVLVISDLNKQIISQKQDLEVTLEELEVNSQEKDRILRTVAHDLRNPIGGIVSLTNAMMDDEYTDEQKQLISLVNGTSYNSLELINEILEATNSSAGKLNKEPVEINALVNNSVEILSFKAAEKDQKIITELLPKAKKVMISRERIWRVISNLISNAIKFSPSGTTISVKITSENNTVNIAVADNGIGIPDEIKDEVFNIFTNAKRNGTAGERSFGLGLSICQQIIENHGGSIWFNANTPAGTIFHISLPL